MHNGWEDEEWRKYYGVDYDNSEEWRDDYKEPEDIPLAD